MVCEVVFVARLAGRNTGFAWVVGVWCAAVVGALVVLAAPMAPVVTDWTLRTLPIIGEQIAHEAGAGEAVASTVPADCDALASPELRAALRAGAPATFTAGAGEVLAGVPGLAELLAAEPAVDCRWTAADGTAQVWVATVGDDAAATAEELLLAVGFECSAHGDGVLCTREHAAAGDAAASTESHLVRGTVWAAIVTSGWEQGGITGAVERMLWPIEPQ